MFLKSYTGRSCVVIAVAMWLGPLADSQAGTASTPVDIGSRRELFVDRFLVAELENATLRLHSPQLMPPVSSPRPNGHYAAVLRARDKFQFYYSTSAAGQVMVEIQDDSGKPIPGFRFADCKPIYGDHIARVVQWKDGADVSSLSGRPIRLCFSMSDADLFSLQFTK